jgi:hypothetical protein
MRSNDAVPIGVGVKIDSISIGQPDRGKRSVTVKIADQKETMTIKVVVSNEHDEDAVRECGIARAKDFARRFANLAVPVISIPGSAQKKGPSPAG